MNEELKVIISAETKKLKDNVKKAKDDIKSFKDQVKEAGKAVDEKFSQMGETIKGAMKTGALAMAGAATALLALGASTAEYRNEQAKLLTAFEAAGSGAEQAKETYNDLFRVLGDSGQATEAANHLAKLTTNQKDLSEWTNICQGVYATFGDSLPIEGLTEAANETAKVGTLTGGLADALNWAGVNEEAFQAQLDACNTEAEREALIRETLNGLYSDAASKYEENNAQIIAQNEAQAKMSDTMAKLGEAVAPINTMLTELGAEILAQLTPFVKDFAEKHLPTIKKVLGEVVQGLTDAIKWMEEHKTLLTVLAVVISEITLAIGIYNTVSAIKAAMEKAETTTVWGLVKAHLAQAAAALTALAPYLLIVAAIAAVIAIIVLCVKYWDEIVAAVKVAINAIVEFVTNLWNKVVEIWGKFVEILSNVASWIYDNVIKPVIDFFVGLWKGIVDTFHMVIDPWIEIIKRASVIIYESVIKPILDYFKKLWNDIKAVFATVANWFNTKIVSPIVNLFKGIWDSLKNGAKNAIDGIKNTFTPIINWFKDTFSKAWQKVKDVFSAGGKIFSGIKEGIERTFKSVVNTIIDGINKVITIPFNAINGVLSKLKGIEILGVKPFGWVNTFNVPQIPKLARGGIVDSATLAVIGEQGKEAVMPLENNTEWIDILASKLAAKQGGNAPIVLQVDGKTFAQISVDSINDLTRQRGSLPLVIA